MERIMYKRMAILNDFNPYNISLIPYINVYYSHWRNSISFGWLAFHCTIYRFKRTSEAIHIDDNKIEYDGDTYNFNCSGAHTSVYTNQKGRVILDNGYPFLFSDYNGGLFMCCLDDERARKKNILHNQ